MWGAFPDREPVPTSPGNARGEEGQKAVSDQAAESTGTAVAQPNRAGAPAAPGVDFGGVAGRVVDSLKRGDLGFALGLVMIMVVLIMPLPPWLLDISLAMSITLAVLI